MVEIMRIVGLITKYKLPEYDDGKGGGKVKRVAGEKCDTWFMNRLPTYELSSISFLQF
jgi:hypothetical protein